MAKNSRYPAFGYSSYRWYAIGLFLAQAAIQMQLVGVTWHVYELTRSAFSLGFLGLVNFIPIVVLSLFGGNVADKYNRQRIILLSSCVFLLCMAGLFLITTTQNISVLLIYGFSVLIASAVAFDLPARQALVPNLVPEKNLVNAVSIATSVRQIALIGGPSIAGILIATYGIASVYLLCTLFFIGTIFTTFPLKTVKQQENIQAESLTASIKEGIKFVAKTPLIYSSMFLDFFATFFASAMVLLPLFAKEILQVGPERLGLLYAAPSIGAVIAGFFVSSIGKFKHSGRILIGSVILYGIATIGFGISKIYILSLFFLALIGIGDMVSTIIRNTLRQLATPDYLRGRMTSINMIFFAGGPQLGEAEAGFLAAIFGGPLSVVIGGVGTILATLTIAYFFPSLRRYKG